MQFWPIFVLISPYEYSKTMDNIKEGITTAILTYTFIAGLAVLWGSVMLYSLRRKKGKKSVSNK